METFRLRDEVKEWTFSIEMPTTAVTGHPYLTHVSTLAVFNKTGSGKLVRVRQIKAERLLAQTTATAVGTNIALQRITAHTVTDEIMPAYTIDTNNASLPSQVVMCRRPAATPSSWRRRSSARKPRSSAWSMRWGMRWPRRREACLAGYLLS